MVFWLATMILYLGGIILPGLFLDRLSTPLGGSEMMWGLVVLLAGVAWFA